MRADLQVASVVRDPQTGQPQRLSEERLTVGASLDDVTAVAWVDEITLAALGSSGVGDVTAYRIPLGGPTQALPFQEGVTGLAAAKERLYILADGLLQQHAVGEDVQPLLRGGQASHPFLEGQRLGGATERDPICRHVPDPAAAQGSEGDLIHPRHLGDVVERGADGQPFLAQPLRLTRLWIADHRRDLQVRPHVCLLYTS